MNVGSPQGHYCCHSTSLQCKPLLIITHHTQSATSQPEHNSAKAAWWTSHARSLTTWHMHSVGEQEQVRCRDYSKVMAFPCMLCACVCVCVCVCLSVAFAGWKQECQIRTGLVYMFTPHTLYTSSLFLLSSRCSHHISLLKVLWNQETAISHSRLSQTFWPGLKSQLTSSLQSENTLFSTVL